MQHKYSYYLMIGYIIVSLLGFMYLGIRYLKSEVYAAGYQKAVLDIATESLTQDGCKNGVLLGLENNTKVLIKSVECINSNTGEDVHLDLLQEEDILLPHLEDPL